VLNTETNERVAIKKIAHALDHVVDAKRTLCETSWLHRARKRAVPQDISIYDVYISIIAFFNFILAFIYFAVRF